MAARLLLVRHAPTAATRAAAFPADEGLDERGRAQAAGLAAELPARATIVCAPARACRETAAAAGLEARVEPALAACDLGAWAGRSLEDVHAADPDGAEAWRDDPDARPHGGESLRGFAARVAAWLDAAAAGEGRTVAVVDAGVVRVAVVHALGAPLPAFWRVDVAPLAVAELAARDGGWALVRLSPARERRP